MEAKFKYLLIFFLFFLFIVAEGCKSQKPEWKGEIDYENGIKVVKNPNEPIHSEIPFDLEEDLTIGEKEGEEEYMFLRIVALDVDDEANIYVLDIRGGHIKVFDKQGKYLRTIGRKGQGPGEMQGPRGMTITPQKEIMVNDAPRRLLSFTLDGKFLRQVSLAKIRFFGNPKVDSQGNIVANCMNIGEPKLGEKAVSELKKFNSDLKPIFSIATNEIAEYPVVNPFFPHYYWGLIKKDNIIWSFPSKYELQVLNPEGKILMKILRDYDPVEITKEEKDKWLKENFGGEVPSGFVIKWSKFHNAFRCLTLDDEGRIFLRTYEKIGEEEGYYYDVFDSEGRYIAKVPLKMEPRIWKKNKLYTIEEDEEGFQVVKRYAVMWH